MLLHQNWLQTTRLCALFGVNVPPETGLVVSLSAPAVFAPNTGLPLLPSHACITPVRRLTLAFSVIVIVFAARIVRVVFAQNAVPPFSSVPENRTARRVYTFATPAWTLLSATVVASIDDSGADHARTMVLPATMFTPGLNVSVVPVVAFDANVWLATLENVTGVDQPPDVIDNW